MSNLDVEVRELLAQGFSPWAVSQICQIPQSWVFEFLSQEEHLDQ